jgi:hypothetical protein
LGCQDLLYRHGFGFERRCCTFGLFGAAAALKQLMSSIKSAIGKPYLPRAMMMLIHRSTPGIDVSTEVPDAPRSEATVGNFQAGLTRDARKPDTKSEQY